MNRQLVLVFGGLLVLYAGARQNARAQNLVVNPGFDHTVAGWSSPSPTELSWDGTRDAGGNPQSGSAQTQNFGGVQITCKTELLQCISVLDPAPTYGFGGEIFIPPGQLGPNNQPVPGSAYVQIHWFTLPACAYDALNPPVGPISGPFVTATGAWIENSGVSNQPPGALSALLEGVSCVSLGAGPLLVNFDDMFFQSTTPMLAPGGR